MDAVLLDLVASIYDAVSDPKQWECFVARLERKLGSPVALFVPCSTAEGSGEAVAPSIAPAYLDSYLRRFFALDPMTPLLKTAPAASAMVIEPRSGKESPETAFDREWLRPQHLQAVPFLMALIERDSAGRAWALRTFPRSRRASSPRSGLRFFARLLPHLRRAARAQMRARELEATRAALLATLDRLRTGLILVDPPRRILATNVSAEGILAARDGLSLEADGLHGMSPRVTHALRELLREALASGPVRSLDRVCDLAALSLPRPSGRRPLTLLVSPLGGRRSLGPRHVSCVALFVSDPEASGEPSADILRQLYALTPAESMLASEIARGHSLEESAEQLAITRETVRTRLKHIFLKTDTHRQIEVMRLLLSGTAQILVDAPSALPEVEDGATPAPS